MSEQQGNEIVGIVKALQISEPEQPVPSAGAFSKGPDGSLTKTTAWTIRELLGQKRYLNTLEYKVADVPQTPLFSFHVTSANMEAKIRRGGISTAMVHDLFQMYKMRIKFTFEVQSTWQHVGMLAMMYVPRDNVAISRLRESSGEGDSIDPWTMYMLNPTFIQLGHNGVYTIETDWISQRAAFFSDRSEENTLYPYFDMGTIVLQTVVPFRVATGVEPTVYIRVWEEIILEDLSLYAPTDTLI